MWRLCLLFCLAVAAGCGGGAESQLTGTWRVDPATVTISRLGPGADKKPDWTDAAAVIGKITVRFRTQPRVVEATGFDQTSTASWHLSGSAIAIEGAQSAWPDMVLDPRGPRIHLTIEKNGDLLQMDLVKVR